MPAQAASTLRIEFPSDTAYLHLITNFARNAGRASGLSESAADQLALATDEAVTNVIEHAYRGHPGRKIEVLARILEDGIEIHVIHQGEPLDPRSLAPEIDPRQLVRSRRKGGLGVVLMRRLVDRVDYRATDDARNECCLTKRKARELRQTEDADAGGR